jgi:hypothetical protein
MLGLSGLPVRQGTSPTNIEALVSFLVRQGQYTVIRSAAAAACLVRIQTYCDALFKNPSTRCICASKDYCAYGCYLQPSYHNHQRSGPNRVTRATRSVISKDKVSPLTNTFPTEPRSSACYFILDHDIQRSDTVNMAVS